MSYRQEQQREAARKTEAEQLKLDARTAYQVAANLYMQENTVTWSRFNIMIAANGAIVAATGVAASASTPLLLLTFYLPLGGLILCYIWWNMTKRGFAYHGVSRDAAYELERVHFRSAACTLWYADQLRHGGNVTITIKGEGA